MRWLQWFGDHVGLALVLATLWFLLVTAGYFAWVVWGGWDRDSDLALAQALLPVAGAGFAFVVVGAAVLAFRPPRPEISCFVRVSTQFVSPAQVGAPGLDQLRGARERVGPTLMIVNSGRLPATDVAVEVVGGTLSMVSRAWKQTTQTPLANRSTLVLDRPEFLTVLERSRSLPDHWEEVVFQTSLDDPFRRVHITASNAAAVTYEPSPDDRGDAPPK